MSEEKDLRADYFRKKEKLVSEFKAILSDKNADLTVSLGGKKTSNLFRDRRQSNTTKINVRDFNKVIFVDAQNLEAEVEGMTTYENLVNETLKYGLLPTVVPQLKSITVGGAATGIGIEASSFKYGFVHETINEMEILTGNGETVLCSPEKNRGLFFGFPNSYGTLGYVLKLKIKLVPAKKFVKIYYTKFTDSVDFFKVMEKVCREARTGGEDNAGGDSVNGRRGAGDFVDGVIFNENEMYLSEAQFVASAPRPSDYKYMGIYYKSLRQKKLDYLTALDYIWRWDPDWFWCSKHYGVQNPILRLLVGKFMLNSVAYWKLKKFFADHGIFKIFEKLQGRREAVIQDVEIPIEKCVDFARFFHGQIGIKPVWVCPVMHYDKKFRYDLYEMDPQKLYVNFGFWDSVATDKQDGFFNKLIEQKVGEVHGRKSLYSTSFYEKEQFWKLYSKKVYDHLKAKYDPRGAFKGLYEKCVLKS